MTFSNQTPNKSFENIFITLNKAFITNNRILNENNYDDEIKRKIKI